MIQLIKVLDYLRVKHSLFTTKNIKRGEKPWIKI